MSEFSDHCLVDIFNPIVDALNLFLDLAEFLCKRFEIQVHISGEQKLWVLDHLVHKDNKAAEEVDERDHKSYQDHRE